MDDGEVEDDDGARTTASSLEAEMTHTLDEKEMVLTQLKFEINSLKKEKAQLYDYINRLLRNPIRPNQNQVLKQKLVNRKILRTVSLSGGGYNSGTQSVKTKALHAAEKRVISNNVNFNKEYGSKSSTRPRKISQPFASVNSDDEDDDEEFEVEKFLLGYPVGHKILGIRAFQWKPTKMLLIEIESDQRDVDEISDDQIDLVD